jgi:hypothetical protein
VEVSELEETQWRLLRGSRSSQQVEEGSIQPGSSCRHADFERDGRHYLQLETYGSDDREQPGKVSQTLQFDAEGARELVRIVKLAFPELS